MVLGTPYLQKLMMQTQCVSTPCCCWTGLVCFVQWPADVSFSLSLYPIRRRKYSFNFHKNRKLLECRQAFTMAKLMASLGLWEMLFLPQFILTVDGLIVMVKGVPCAKVWSTNSMVKACLHQELSIV